MRIIKLDATGSTNATLKELWQNNHAIDETVVWAENQTEGRGQQGTVWQSEAGKNLTFSFLKKFEALPIRDQFGLNIAVSLSVYQLLQELRIPDIHVKWPNDILSGSTKICGILIENIVKSNSIQAAIIGIGLNVNQEDFSSLPGAGSLKTETGKNWDIALIFKKLFDKLRVNLADLDEESLPLLRSDYMDLMYRKDELSVFSTDGNTRKTGIIRGISQQGLLLVEFDGSISEFGMKEISLLQ